MVSMGSPGLGIIGLGCREVGSLRRGGQKVGRSGGAGALSDHCLATGHTIPYITFSKDVQPLNVYL